MNRYKPGMLARSLAGHDCDKVYMIVREEGAFVFLSDGDVRPMAKPKKKRKIHTQLICKQHDMTEMDDGQIAYLLRTYKKEEI